MAAEQKARVTYEHLENAIHSARSIDSIIKTKYFSIDGIRANTPTKKGIYIRQDQHADGSVKQVKTVVE